MQLIIGGAGVIISALVSFLIASSRIGEYKNKVDTAVSDITDLKKELKEVRDKAVACETSLKEREPLTRKRSPIALTDRGSKVLNESGGKKFIEDNYEELKNNVDEKKPETSYDIQEISRNVIEEMKNDQRLNSLKEYLFKEGMELDDIVEVLGIYLRDKILNDKKLSVKDIDNYDPKRKN